MNKPHSQTAYVFVDIAGETLVAGIIKYTAEQPHTPYQFRYGQSYLANPSAFALDPLHLPLQNDTSNWASLPGALSDACPDDWGKHIYTAITGDVPSNDIDYLLSNTNLGAGLLSFSNTLKPPQTNPAIGIESLDELFDAYKAIELGQSPPKHLRPLLQHGSSLGGARPKTVLHKNDGSQWVVKFPRPGDLFNNVLAEYAAMGLAEEAGIQVPNIALHELPQGPVLLVQRFDRKADGSRLHYLSAMSLIGPGTIPLHSFNDIISYANIAYKMALIGCTAADKIELYRRMLFNSLLGNLDDHLKNHGCLKQSDQHQYGLSPAFDIVPTPEKDRHHIAVGNKGVMRSQENLLSRCEAFGVQLTEAKQMLKELRGIVSQYPSRLKATDMKAQDIRLLEQHIDLLL